VALISVAVVVAGGRDGVVSTVDPGRLREDGGRFAVGERGGGREARHADDAGRDGGGHARRHDGRFGQRSREPGAPTDRAAGVEGQAGVVAGSAEVLVKGGHAESFPGEGQAAG
jgi:hypothetical protein